MWTPTGAIGWPGPGELLIIFAIVLLLFGGSKLPQVARSMGQAMRAFKEEANKLKSEIELEAEPEQKGKSAPSTGRKESSVSASAAAEKPQPEPEPEPEAAGQKRSG